MSRGPSTGICFVAPLLAMTDPTREIITLDDGAGRIGGEMILGTGGGGSPYLGLEHAPALSEEHG